MALLIADGVFGRTMSLVVGRDFATPGTPLGVVRLPLTPLNSPDREIRLLVTAGPTQHRLLLLYSF
jgi:hypothetical protein